MSPTLQRLMSFLRSNGYARKVRKGLFSSSEVPFTADWRLNDVLWDVAKGKAGGRLSNGRTLQDFANDINDEFGCGIGNLPIGMTLREIADHLDTAGDKRTADDLFQD